MRLRRHCPNFCCPPPIRWPVGSPFHRSLAMNAFLFSAKAHPAPHLRLWFDRAKRFLRNREPEPCGLSQFPAVLWIDGPSRAILLSRGSRDSDGKKEDEGRGESNEQANLVSGPRVSRSGSSASRSARSSAQGGPASTGAAPEKNAFIVSEAKRPLSPGSPRSILSPRGRPLDASTSTLVTPFDVATHLFDLLFLGTEIEELKAEHFPLIPPCLLCSISITHSTWFGEKDAPHTTANL